MVVVVGEEMVVIVMAYVQPGITCDAGHSVPQQS